MNISKVLLTLEKIESLLIKHKVSYAPFLHDIIIHFRSTDPLGSRDQIFPEDIRKHLLGGMGSLNDVWISKKNGDEVEDEESANRKLDGLRKKLHGFLTEQ